MNRLVLSQSVAFGVLGALTLVLADIYFIAGKEVFYWYGGLFLALIWGARRFASYWQRWQFATGAFAITLIAHAIETLIKSHAFGRVPIYFMILSPLVVIAIGAAINLAVAAVASPANAQPESLPR